MHIPPMTQRFVLHHRMQQFLGRRSRDDAAQGEASALECACVSVSSWRPGCRHDAL